MKVDGLKTELNVKVDGLRTELNTEIDGIDKKIDTKIDQLQDRMQNRYVPLNYLSPFILTNPVTKTLRPVFKTPILRAPTRS